MRTPVRWGKYGNLVGGPGRRRAYVTLRQTAQRAIHLHPLKKQTQRVTGLVLILQWKFTNWLLLFFLRCGVVRRSALSYFWADTPMNRMRIEFPGSQAGIFPGNPHINGIINTSIGSCWKFRQDEAEGRRELTNKQHQKRLWGLLKELPIAEQNANFRAVSFARSTRIPISFVGNRVSWVVAFDLKFV